MASRNAQGGTAIALPLPRRSAAEWTTVGARIKQSRETAKIDLEAAAVALEIEPGELAQLEGGAPVLGSYELEQLARLLNATLGSWVYEDERPLFRGADADAARAAELAGLELMTQYLAVEAQLG